MATVHALQGRTGFLFRNSVCACDAHHFRSKCFHSVVYSVCASLSHPRARQCSPIRLARFLDDDVDVLEEIQQRARKFRGIKRALLDVLRALQEIDAGAHQDLSIFNLNILRDGTCQFDQFYKQIFQSLFVHLIPLLQPLIPHGRCVLWALCDVRDVLRAHAQATFIRSLVTETVSE